MLKGSVSFVLENMDTRRDLRYFIKISKEFTKRGAHLIGVLVIEIRRKILDNHMKVEKRIGRYIVNLGAFLRSTRSGEDVDALQLLGNIFASRGVQEVIVPIYFLIELKDRLVPIINDIREDIKEILEGEDLHVVSVHLRMTSRTVDTSPSEVLTDLMKIVISQYIDVSELHLLERDLKKLYGIVDEKATKEILERWQVSLNEILSLLIQYSVLLFKDKKFDKIKFLEALSKSLSPNKVKIALRRFISLARENVDEKTYGMFMNILQEILSGTTLEGFERDVEPLLIEETYTKSIQKLINPALKGFSRKLTKILSLIRKMGDADTTIDSIVREIIYRTDLSEDDKTVVAIILTLLIKPSKLRAILYMLKGHMLCDACPGSKMINLIPLVARKPSRKLMNEFSVLINLLTYSSDLKYETYQLYLLLAYIFKALVANKLALQEIEEACLRTARKIIKKEKLLPERFIECVYTWGKRRK